MLACVGISHHTAPPGMFEEVFFAEADVRALLPELKTLGVSEGVLFSAPARTELYVYSEQVDLLADSLIYFLRKKGSIEATVPTAHFFALHGIAVAEHLFNVVTGIDSMIVGDNQANDYVRAGLAVALKTGVAGPVMKELFDSAFKCAKRACDSTSISEGAISVSTAAVELAQHIFDELKRKTIFVIGSGETVQLMAQHLKDRGIGTTYVTHSAAEKARSLASSLGGIPIPYDRIRETLPDVDIVLSSHQAAPFLLSKQDLKDAGRTRSRGTLLLIDLGMPRNVDPFATELEQVFLYDLDTLAILVGENISRRRADIPHVQAMIADDINRLVRSGKPWSLLKS